MNKNIISLVVLVVTLVAVCSSAASNSHAGWTNEDVTRTIDLTSQLAKQTVQIKAKNTGSQSASTYSFALHSSTEHASLQAFVDGDDQQLQIVQTSVKTHNQQKYTLYDVQLKKSVSAGSTLSIKLRIVGMGQQQPYPTQIPQMSNQLVIFKENTYFSSPYDTTTQKTTIKLASSKVENHSTLTPSVVKGNSIVYGPYKDVAPLSFHALSVHYENNASFVMLNSLTKEYEVSHWGNVAVETSYAIEHRGAALKGSFSRFDYQRQPHASPSHVAEIVERVPLGSADFYYRDYIGNISTSQYHHTANHLDFKIQPRFPLFGGWKNEFYTGYNLPSSSLLFVDDSTGRFVLNATFGVAITDIYAVHHALVVVLPEGAADIQISAPFHFVREDSIRKTFLDTVGRPVVILRANWTSIEQTQTVQISYSMAPFSIFHEPILAIGAVFALCVLFMVGSRLDMSLIRKGPKIARNPEVDKLAQQYLSAFESRLQYHVEVEEALQAYSRSSSYSAYQVAKQAIDAKYKDTLVLTKLIQSISSIDPIYSARLKELSDQETQMSQIQNQLVELEKSKPTPKQQYEDVRSKYLANYRKAYDDAVHSLDQLLS